MAPKPHYFDYAATTPVDPRVLRAMHPYFSDKFGNPASLYGLGRQSRNAIDRAAQELAAALHAEPHEIVFTGSATEADNLAIAGIFRANRELGDKIIVSRVEHKGILAIARALAKEGLRVTELPVNAKGQVDPRELERELDDRTLLVSVTAADSETGTLQPLAALGRVIREFRRKHKTALPYFHTDASQAFGYLDLHPDRTGFDLATVSAHKLYGPKGIGALYVRRGVKISPLILGGGQKTLRSGTENVPGIVGFGEAVRIAHAERYRESARLGKLRDRLQAGILRRIPKIRLNGHLRARLPNFLNLSVLDVEGEAMLLYLDAVGIIASTGSACNSESLEPSYVLMAQGNPYEFIHGSLRFTLGRFTRPEDVAYVLRELPGIVAKLRKISPLNLKPEGQKGVAVPKAFVGGQTPHFLKKKK